MPCNKKQCPVLEASYDYATATQLYQCGITKHAVEDTPENEVCQLVQRIQVLEEALNMRVTGGERLAGAPRYQNTCERCIFIQNIEVNGSFHDVYRCDECDESGLLWLSRHGDEEGQCFTALEKTLRGMHGLTAEGMPVAYALQQVAAKWGVVIGGVALHAYDCADCEYICTIGNVDVHRCVSDPKAVRWVVVYHGVVGGQGSYLETDLRDRILAHFSPLEHFIQRLIRERDATKGGEEKSVESPYFQHDCDECEFIGNLAIDEVKHDIYRCLDSQHINEAMRDEYKSLDIHFVPVWVVRFSNDPIDIWQMPLELFRDFPIQADNELLLTVRRIAEERESQETSTGLCPSSKLPVPYNGHECDQCKLMCAMSLNGVSFDIYCCSTPRPLWIARSDDPNYRYQQMWESDLIEKSPLGLSSLGLEMKRLAEEKRRT